MDIETAFFIRYGILGVVVAFLSHVIYPYIEEQLRYKPISHILWVRLGLVIIFGFLTLHPYIQFASHAGEVDEAVVWSGLLQIVGVTGLIYVVLFLFAMVPMSSLVGVLVAFVVGAAWELLPEGQPLPDLFLYERKTSQLITGLLGGIVAAAVERGTEKAIFLFGLARMFGEVLRALRQK